MESCIRAQIDLIIVVGSVPTWRCFFIVDIYFILLYVFYYLSTSLVYCYFLSPFMISWSFAVLLVIPKILTLLIRLKTTWSSIMAVASLDPFLDFLFYLSNFLLWFTSLIVFLAKSFLTIYSYLSGYIEGKYFLLIHWWNIKIKLNWVRSWN